ncbi:MAG: REP-associated tyrosine transposase [bacterium]
MSGPLSDGPDPVGRKDGALAPSAYPRREPRSRIPSFDYVGRFAYHVILPTQNRAPRLRNAAFGQRCVQVLQETAALCQFRLLAFCFMPDHLHVLAVGEEETSDLVRLVQRFKQKTAFEFKRETGERLWQQSFYDRTLRVDEDLPTVAQYIFGNPIKVGLATEMGECALSGGEYAADEAEASFLRRTGTPHG